MKIEPNLINEEAAQVLINNIITAQRVLDSVGLNKFSCQDINYIFNWVDPINKDSNHIISRFLGTEEFKQMVTPTVGPEVVEDLTPEVAEHE